MSPWWNINQSVWAEYIHSVGNNSHATQETFEIQLHVLLTYVYIKPWMNCTYRTHYRKPITKKHLPSSLDLLPINPLRDGMDLSPQFFEFRIVVGMPFYKGQQVSFG